jgi:hypothetical protein
VANLTGKAKKASVLDQSKENWDKFKETDGKAYVHDMEQAKKDGYETRVTLSLCLHSNLAMATDRCDVLSRVRRYLDKVEFLERADVKQFERERDLRAKRRNPLLKRTDE